MTNDKGAEHEKLWVGADEAEKLFPNLFNRLQYVAECRHVNFDNAAYEAHEYFKKLVQECCLEGIRLSEALAEVVPVLDVLMKHCAESHYNDCAWLHTDESECNCGSEKAWDEARALLEKLK